MAEFHNVDGRTVRVLQIAPPNPVCWAVFFAEDTGETGDLVTWTPVACFGLVEGDAGHGPEQDIVPFTVGDTGDLEIASDRVDFAGLTYEKTYLQPRSDSSSADREAQQARIKRMWRSRWLARTRADELMGAMPPAEQLTDPFGDAGPGIPT